MRKVILFFIYLCGCLNFPLSGNEDLLKLFHLAVENRDVKLVTEIIDALLKDEKSNKYLFDALVKYNEKGKIDFALHNAIKDKNLLASVVLVQYTKDINSRVPYNEVVWLSSIYSISRPNKTPLQLALEANMSEIIPYLLMKGSSPYLMSSIGFLYEDEEDINYLVDLGYDEELERKVCEKSKRPFCKINTNTLGIARTFIGELICKNRLDIIEMLQAWQKPSIDWNKPCFVSTFHGTSCTPLQLALTIKRYEIVQFLIDHGAWIE